MSTYNDAWQAGIDAVVADNALNRGGFADAIRTVVTIQFSNSDATDWIDAVATELNRVGLINNPTYNNMRGNIINDAVAHRAMFDALATIGRLPETQPAIAALNLLELREERDNIDAAIDRCNVLIAAEPPGVVGRRGRRSRSRDLDRRARHSQRRRRHRRGAADDVDHSGRDHHHGRRNHHHRAGDHHHGGGPCAAGR